MDQGDTLFVVAIESAGVKRLGEAVMRVIGFSGSVACGGGEERRPLGKRGAIRLGVVRGANHVVADRLIADRPVDRQPIGHARMFLDRRENSLDERRVVVESCRFHYSFILEVQIQAAKPRVGNHRHGKPAATGHLHLFVGVAEVELRLALFESEIAHVRHAGKRGEAAIVELAQAALGHHVGPCLGFWIAAVPGNSDLMAERANRNIHRIERAGIDEIFHRRLGRLSMFGRNSDLAVIDSWLGVIGSMNREPKPARNAFRRLDCISRDDHPRRDGINRAVGTDARHPV